MTSSHFSYWLGRNGVARPTMRKQALKKLYWSSHAYASSTNERSVHVDLITPPSQLGCILLVVIHTRLNPPSSSMSRCLSLKIVGM